MDLSTLGVLRRNAQNLTRRRDESEAKESEFGRHGISEKEGKPMEMPLFFLAVGGPGAARRSIFHSIFFSDFGPNPSLGTPNPSLGTFSQLIF